MQRLPMESAANGNLAGEMWRDRIQSPPGNPQEPKQAERDARRRIPAQMPRQRSLPDGLPEFLQSQSRHCHGAASGAPELLPKRCGRPVPRQLDLAPLAEALRRRGGHLQNRGTEHGRGLPVQDPRRVSCGGRQYAAGGADDLRHGAVRDPHAARGNPAENHRRQSPGQAPDLRMCGLRALRPLREDPFGNHPGGISGTVPIQDQGDIVSGIIKNLL